jgi:hypothetical protein
MGFSQMEHNFGQVGQTKKILSQDGQWVSSQMKHFIKLNKQKKHLHHLDGF